MANLPLIERYLLFGSGAGAYWVKAGAPIDSAGSACIAFEDTNGLGVFLEGGVGGQICAVIVSY